jgi:single-strand DNA-binding protein
MAQLFGLARLAKTVELRKAGNDSVCNLVLAFSYGKKDATTGYKPTQWVDASLWGKQAEALAEYLVAGKNVVVTIDDVHTEEYQGKNGTATKLVGRISKLDFAADSGQSQAQQAPRPAAPAPRPAARPAHDLSDMDDDIPF